MPRLMSFSKTVEQVYDRTKCVTRRLGTWRKLKPGTILQAVEKGQGIPKGGKVQRICLIRVLDVRFELLQEVQRCNPDLEGFPHMTAREFTRLLFDVPLEPDPLAHILVTGSAARITRIAFEYVDEKHERIPGQHSAEAAINGDNYIGEGVHAGETYILNTAYKSEIPNHIINGVRVGIAGPVRAGYSYVSSQTFHDHDDMQESKSLEWMHLNAAAAGIDMLTLTPVYSQHAHRVAGKITHRYEVNISPRPDGSWKAYANEFAGYSPVEIGGLISLAQFTLPKELLSFVTEPAPFPQWEEGAGRLGITRPYPLTPSKDLVFGQHLRGAAHFNQAMIENGDPWRLSVITTIQTYITENPHLVAQWIITHGEI